MDSIQEQLLAVVRYQLFGGGKPTINKEELSDILKEAKAQTVFTTVFPLLQEKLKESSPNEFLQYQEEFYGNVITNTNNFMEHAELHSLMTENDIPYVMMKGLASAYCYPDSSLRDMGDVDFLVYEKDFERAKQAVLSAGFEVDHGDTLDSIHIAFKRDPLSIWEMHRSINGIPDGEIGERICADMATVIESAELVELDGAVCRIPDKFHHGLIMLLHMISHMTSEGFGLRHLCDWAVFVNSFNSDEFRKTFVNSFNSDEFRKTFESKLKSYGIWKFAQTLTLVSQRYLGLPEKEWATNPEITDELLEEFIVDILNGGNFGKKDMNRYRETKYISNRGERTVDNKNVFMQLFGTLNQKTYYDYKWIKKCKVFLPIGWIAEGGKYVGLLVSGKRKSKNTSAMLKEAAKRKDIYSQMKLFEVK